MPMKRKSKTITKISSYKRRKPGGKRSHIAVSKNKRIIKKNFKNRSVRFDKKRYATLKEIEKEYDDTIIVNKDKRTVSEELHSINDYRTKFKALHKPFGNHKGDLEMLLSKDNKSREHHVIYEKPNGFLILSHIDNTDPHQFPYVVGHYVDKEKAYDRQTIWIPKPLERESMDTIDPDDVDKIFFFERKRKAQPIEKLDDIDGLEKYLFEIEKKNYKSVAFDLTGLSKKERKLLEKQIEKHLGQSDVKIVIVEN